MRDEADWDFDQSFAINQGDEISDCVLLTVMDCLLHLGNQGLAGKAHFKSLFQFNDDESVQVTLYSQNDISQAFINSDYRYRHDEVLKKDFFTISKEKIQAIKNATNGAKSPLPIKIIERLSAYYMKNWVKKDDSLEGHSIINHNFGSQEPIEFFGSLLGLQTRKELSINDIIRLKRLVPHMPIYIDILYGKIDKDAPIQSAHALRLESIKKTKKGIIFTLVNPWNNKIREEHSYADLVAREIRSSILTLSEEELTHVNAIITSESDHYVLALKKILLEEYHADRYQSFRPFVSSIQDINRLEKLIFIHNKLQRYQNNTKAYETVTTIQSSIYKNLEAIRELLTNNFALDENAIYNRFKTIKKGHLSASERIYDNYIQYKSKNEAYSKQLNPTEETAPNNFYLPKATPSLQVYHFQLEQYKRECYKHLIKLNKLPIDSEAITKESLKTLANSNDLQEIKALRNKLISIEIKEEAQQSLIRINNLGMITLSLDINSITNREDLTTKSQQLISIFDLLIIIRNKSQELRTLSGSHEEQKALLIDTNTSLENILQELTQCARNLVEFLTATQSSFEFLQQMVSYNQLIATIRDFATLKENNSGACADIKFTDFLCEFDTNKLTFTQFELKKRKRVLDDIISRRKQCELLTNLIAKYKIERQYLLFFKGSAENNPTRLETAFYKVPVVLRGRIYDELDAIQSLTDADKISVLNLREMLNPFKKALQPKESANTPGI